MTRYIHVDTLPSITLTSDTWTPNDPCDLMASAWTSYAIVEDGGSPLTFISVWSYDPGNHPGEGPDPVTGIAVTDSIETVLDALADNIRTHAGVNHAVHWPNGHISPA